MILLRKNVVAVLLGLFMLSSMAAQEKRNYVSGNIKNNEKAVPRATVVLFRIIDSVAVKFTATDEKGFFDFDNQPAGHYVLKITSIGYEDLSTSSFNLGDRDTIAMGTIQLTIAAKQLDEAVLRSRKPLIQIKNDRLIFNVENSISAIGNNAFELLRKSPGVTISSNDNIALKGKSGVNIYIDGKPTNLASDQLIEYLKTLNSGNIEAIEIISNPGASFEASGTAGIINIRMKKNKRKGFNGSLSLGYIQWYTAKTSNSFNLNYRNSKINAFGSYSNSFGIYRKTLEGYRIQIDSLYDIYNTNRNNRKTHNFKTGMDYFINPRNTIGVMVNGSYLDGRVIYKGESNIRGVNNASISEILNSENDVKSHLNNLNVNLNYKFADTTGKVVNVDIDRAIFRATGTSFQPNTYIDPANGQVKYIRNFSNNTPVDIDIYTAKVDFETNLKKGRIAFGIKSSYVKSANTFEFFDEYPVRKLLADKSNLFNYDEYINAGYTNYTVSLSQKWDLQAGLRLEHTYSRGVLTRYDNTQAGTDDNVKRNYLNLFPSTAITWKANDKNSFNLTFSRRINRPTYQDLNPFENKLDELSYEKGNAFLKPQYSNSTELTHTFKNFLNTAINYSFTSNFVAVVNDTINRKGVLISPRNLDKQRMLGIVITANVPITKWLESYFYAGLNKQWLQSNIAPGKIVDIGFTTFAGYMQHSLNLGKGYSAEVSAWFLSGGLWGIFRESSNGSFDFAIQKRILKNTASVKLAFNDILFTTPNSSTSDFGGSFLTFRNMSENRLVRLSFNWRFGRSEVQAARERSTGSDSESGRIRN
jgi:iron complex outermembrane recepter protein